MKVRYLTVVLFLTAAVLSLCTEAQTSATVESALTANATAVSTGQSARLHVVLVSIPCYGHLNPLRAIGRALHRRGHHVTLLMETSKMAWCAAADEGETLPEGSVVEGGTFNCVPIKESGTFRHDFFIEMSKNPDVGASFMELFEEMITFHDRMLGPISEAVYALRAVGAGGPNARAKALAAGFSLALFSQLQHLPPPTTILADASTLPALAIAAQFEIPFASLFPLSVVLARTMATYLPTLGSGLPSSAHMTFADRLHTYITRIAIAIVPEAVYFPKLDAARAATTAALRAKFGPSFPAIPPLVASGAEVGGMNSLVFAPGIWGYDMAQPLCANMVAIGSTAADARRMIPDRRVLEAAPALDDADAALKAVQRAYQAQSAESLEDDLREFLEYAPACVEHGAVYVNFGTLSVLSDTTFERVLKALWQSRSCIVWKITEPARLATVRDAIQQERPHEQLLQQVSALAESKAAEGSAAPATPAAYGRDGVAANGDVSPRGRFYLSRRFKSPSAILDHPNTRAFITHCGDTSVLESVAALVPMAGIPMFADQADVCQRVQESGMGEYVGPKMTFSSERLTNILARLTTRGEARQAYLTRVARVRHMSLLLGGPDRAAEVLESYHRLGLFAFRDDVHLRPAGGQQRYFTIPAANADTQVPYVNPPAFTEAFAAAGAGRAIAPTPAIGVRSRWVEQNGFHFVVVHVWVLVAIFAARGLLRCLCRPKRRATTFSGVTDAAKGAAASVVKTDSVTRMAPPKPQPEAPAPTVAAKDSPPRRTIRLRAAPRDD